jgi:hypothetical protein
MPQHIEPTLAELQLRMSRALLAQEAAAQALPAGWFAGAHAGAEGLRVHRNTVLGGFAAALRQSYPALDALVGEDFFDRMAVAWARSAPPAEPQLADWGEGFANFAGGFPGTEHLGFITELARFEWQLDELGRTVAQPIESAPAHVLAEGLELRFAPTLRLLPTQYPVAALHEALLDGDAERVALLAEQQGEGGQALWRDAAGVHSRTLRPEATRCLALLLAGDELPAALEAARGETSESDYMAIITADLLQAGFTQISGATS